MRDFWFGKLPLVAGAARSAHAAVVRRRRAPRSCSRQRRRAIREQLRAADRARRAASSTQWADGPRRRLSLILLLDQFPRNIYRGTARAFAGDEQALGARALRHAVRRGRGARIPWSECSSTCRCSTPKSLEVQDESVAAYRRLLSEAPEPLQRLFEALLEFAERHREVIQRFGRFPHRNACSAARARRKRQAWLRRAARLRS